MLFTGKCEHEEGAHAQKGHTPDGDAHPLHLRRLRRTVPEQGIRAATVDHSVWPEGIALSAFDGFKNLSVGLLVASGSISFHATNPVYGGESGIRTHGTLRYTRFPSVRLKPLGHLSHSVSGASAAPQPRLNDFTILNFPQQRFAPNPPTPNSTPRSVKVNKAHAFPLSSHAIHPPHPLP
jgi:hypothetical protein